MYPSKLEDRKSTQEDGAVPTNVFVFRMKCLSNGESPWMDLLIANYPGYGRRRLCVCNKHSQILSFQTGKLPWHEFSQTHHVFIL